MEFTRKYLVLFVVVAVILGIAFWGDSGVGGTTNFDAITLDDGGLTISDGDLSVTGATVVDEFTQGGGVLAITESDSGVTLTEAQLLSNNVIRMTGSTFASATTVTLPATSTMTTLLANAGDYRTWIIENANTAAATTTTIAAGTGIDLQEPDGQNVVIGINNYAFITCFREVSTNVVCRVDETIPAD